MILRERLAGLGYQARTVARRATPVLSEIASAIGAEVRENLFGEYLVIEDLLPLPYPTRWDRESAGALGRVDGAHLSEPGLCFIDTETTGLSGGVGTHAFLVAMAWRSGDGLLFRQYLLPDPAAERAMLAAVAVDLRDSSGLVSYNGRSFDVPVLEGRLVINGHDTSGLRLPHLDLLHPVRRVYKARLGSCTLGNVEARVLGSDRGEDIPGHLIPEMYFRFLRGRDPAVLRDVLAHNRQDVVSLSLLLDHLCTVLGDCRGEHPLDRFGVARLLEAQGRVEDAEPIYTGLWEELGAAGAGAWDGAVWPGHWSPVELAYVVGMRLAGLRRRAGDAAAAEPILESLMGTHPEPWEAGIMLAKDLEHRRKDRPGALEVVAAALVVLGPRANRTPRESRWLADLTRRSARLQKHLTGGSRSDRSGGGKA